MKKVILVLSILFVSAIGVYSGTTTMTDIFAVGDNGSGGRLFRVTSTGGIVADGNNTFSGTSATTGLITATGGVTIPSGATLTLASGSTLVSTGMVVMQNITGANGLTVSTFINCSSATVTYGITAGSVTTSGLAQVGNFTASGTAGITGVTTTKAITAQDTITETYGIQTATIVVSGTSKLQGVATFTVGPISSAGKYGYTDSATNTLYHVLLATTMAAGSSVDLTLADGKIGSFVVRCSTIEVSGSFIADGTVTLTARSGSAQSTTLTDPAVVAVGDGGTVVRVRQNAFASAVAFIEYWYIN